MTQVRVLAIVALAVVLAGCTGGGDPEPSPSTTPIGAPSATTPSASAEPSPPTPSPTAAVTPSPTASPTTPSSPTPTPAPTAQVPDDLSTITEDGEVTIAEAQAVVDIQTAIYNDAVIALLTRDESITGGVGATFLEEVARVYSPGMLNQYATVWNQLAESDFENFNRRDPTGVTDRVQRIVDVRPTCFEAIVLRRYEGISDNPPPDDRYWVSFRQMPQLPAQNPAGWHRDIETTRQPDERLCDAEFDS